MTLERFTADMGRVREFLGRKQQLAEDAFWRIGIHRLGTSAKQGHRSGYWTGVEDVLNAQHGIDELTTGELLRELRKGSGSIFWPLMSHDPKFWADCPRCHRRVLIDVEGLCPDCAYEFEEEN